MGWRASNGTWPSDRATKLLPTLSLAFKFAVEEGTEDPRSLLGPILGQDDELFGDAEDGHEEQEGQEGQEGQEQSQKETLSSQGDKGEL